MSTTPLQLAADRLVELGRRRDHLEAHTAYLARDIAALAASGQTMNVTFEARVIDYRNARDELAEVRREYAALLGIPSSH